jgi:aminoglycoside/choline kinase family phosphotransferase
VYDDVAPHVPLRMPRRYYGDMRLDTNEFILLIEDMAPARIGDQIAGCSAADAAAIVPQLAEFHARFWEGPLLGQFDWMPYYNDPCHHHAQASYRQAWPPFQTFVGDRLPAPVREAGERLNDQVVRLLDLLSEPPVTVMHGDFRLDNLVFPNGDAAGMGVLDWQITSRGRGAFDLGYFFTTSLSPADRAAHDERLLRLYVDALADGGVRGYGMDECMRDYRLTVMFCMVYTVILIGSLDVGNERGLALFNALLERNTAAIMDLKAYELV